MCRMLIAVGDYAITDMVRGVQAMACGVRAPSDATVREHPNGWGMIHRGFGEAATVVHRNVRPLAAFDAADFASHPPGLTAIHARHATRPGTLGLDFTHPLSRDGMYFFHNGYAPNATRRMSRHPDSFDSLALFDWLAPPRLGFPSPEQVAARLDAMGSGGTSANSFLISNEAVIIANWFEVNERFYTLWLLEDARGWVCASETLPELAPAGKWRPLGHGQVLRIPLEGEFR